MSKVPLTKEEVRKGWIKHIEWQGKLIDATIKTLEVSVNKCLPDTADLAARASALIGSTRNTVTSAHMFEDLTEKQMTEYLSQSYRRDEKLSKLTGTFKIKCHCHVK